MDLFVGAPTPLIAGAADPWTTIGHVLTGSLTAAVYALVWYARAHEQGETFDIDKFGATLVVGTAVGAAVALDPTQALAQADLEARLAAYVGIISLIEALLKAARNRAQHNPA